MIWLYRFIGVMLASAGVGGLLFITYALFTRTNFGLVVLVRMGMPAVLLGTLAGAGVVGLGVWLAGFAHPLRSKLARP